jgi:hypothetical protein
MVNDLLCLVTPKGKCPLLPKTKMSPIDKLTLSNFLPKGGSVNGGQANYEQKRMALLHNSLVVASRAFCGEAIQVIP